MYANDWENPQKIAENKLPPHADRNYPLRMSLNGIWQFGSFLPENLEQFKTLELPDSLEVPFHPEIAGYNIPIYTNSQYPIPVNPPFVPHDNNPLSVYRREFEVPENWNGKRIILSFQGADSFLKIAVNGKDAGYSKGSRNPAEFDITEYLQPGKNRLDAATLRWTDASYMEDQDMWWLSGIFREVFLYAAGPCFIEDFEVKTTLDTFSLSVKTTTPCKVRVELENVFSGDIVSGEELTQKVQVSPWSAEKPVLYRLKLTTPDDEVETKIGFRTVEIRDGELLINGKSVKLFGVNCHEFNSKRGRAITEEDIRWDVQTIKAHNFNAVRNSHYPHQSLWYDLCDEYGLYMIDEADLETHGVTTLSDNPEWQAAYLDRQTRMLERNKNHPSIIIWSIGNESWTGRNIEACADYLHRRDPSRPVNYYHGGSDPYVDIVDMHYPPLDAIREKLQTETSGRPILLEEFAHSMGNGTGNMAEYVALWESEKRLIGGFIWDWIDQGLEKTGPDGKTFFAYGGDFGDTPNDYQFCHNGLVLPDRKIKGALKDLKHVFRPFLFSVNNGTLSVRNRCAFLDLNEFRVLINGENHTFTCPPGEVRSLLEQVPEYLEIQVLDKQGATIEEEQFGLPELPQIPLPGEADPNVDFNAEGKLIRWNGINLEGLSVELFRAPTNNDKPFLEIWQPLAECPEPEFKLIAMTKNDAKIQQKSPFFTAIQSYHFYDNGFDLTVEFQPEANLPECLPKLGLLLKLPEQFNRHFWFGRGPQECYRDRCSGAKIGRYSATVDELWNRYVMPQENGNHCDVYVAGVCDCNGNGFGCYSQIPFETSLRRWDAKTMAKAQHEYDLPESKTLYWSLDWKNAGLGNASHGPATLPTYRITPEHTVWTWHFFYFTDEFSNQFK